MEVIGKYEVRGAIWYQPMACCSRRKFREKFWRKWPRSEAAPALDLSAIAEKTTEIVVEQTTNIPRIAVVPMGEVATGLRPFEFDVGQLHLQAGDRGIVFTTRTSMSRIR